MVCVSPKREKIVTKKVYLKCRINKHCNFRKVCTSHYLINLILLVNQSDKIICYWIQASINNIVNEPFHRWTLFVAIVIPHLCPVDKAYAFMCRVWPLHRLFCGNSLWSGTGRFVDRPCLQQGPASRSENSAEIDIQTYALQTDTFLSKISSYSRRR